MSWEFGMAGTSDQMPDLEKELRKFATEHKEDFGITFSSFKYTSEGKVEEAFNLHEPQEEKEDG